MRTLLASTVVTLALAAPAVAAQHGTPEEAQAMLARAVEAILADEPATLAAINAHDPRFLDGELYVVCGGDDGMLTAHALKSYEVGLINMRDFVDRGGRPTGEIVYQAAVAGEMHTVEYSYPKPGDSRPSEKVSYVIRVADQVCTVGYYK